METVTIILPLAIICFLGFLSIKLAWFEKHHVTAISALCFSFLIPLFLFRSTSQADLSAALSLSWFTSFYSAFLILFFGVFGFYRHFLKVSSSDASLAALAGTYSNTVLISIPVLVGLLGEQTAGQAFVLIAFHSAILFTLTEVFIRKLSIGNFVNSLKNPIVLSIAGGLSFNLMGLTIPEWILTPMTMLSSSAIPLALFGLGASMSLLPLKGNRSAALVLSSVKLLVLPLLGYLITTFVFGLTGDARLIIVLLLASPTGVNAFIMASKHKTQEGLCATTVVFSTILCIVSIAFWSVLLTTK